MADEQRARGGAAVTPGLVGPVLVVADADAIGRLAPLWAEAFAAAGLRYRVRLVSGVGGQPEIDAVAGELAGQGARSCAAAGAEPAMALARAVAARAGVACIPLESRADSAATD